jgi:hypothetical protein
LVGLAIVVGIVLLNVVDRGTPSPGGTGGTGGPAPTVPRTTGSTAATAAGATTTTKAGTSLTTTGVTTTTKKGLGRSAKEVRVTVLNASGVGQAAQTRANDLTALGYVIASTGNAAAMQTGNTVVCRTGFDKEAKTLATKVAGATVSGTFPSQPPENTDCIVTLGKT